MTAPQSEFLNLSYAILNFVLKFFNIGIQIPKGDIQISLV